MEVLHLDGLLDGQQTEIVCGSDANAGPNTATSHPNGKPCGVVLATEVALHHGRATKFAGPDDEGFIEQAPLFQIGQQGCYGLVGPAGAGFVVFD